MSAQKQIEIAKSLPPRLLRFFQKYPPPALFPNITSQMQADLSNASTAPTPEPVSTTPPSDPNAPMAEASSSSAPAATSPPVLYTSEPASPPTLPYPNPFLPTKNYATGRWHGPVYGLRKQADLVKLASSYGVVDLLPWTIKKPGEKEKRRMERGLQVKGTGEGQKVKGKMWERTMKGRLEMRRQAMLNMPSLIQEWKQVSCVFATKSWWLCMITDKSVERTWARVEKVAEWKGEMSGESVVNRIWNCISCVYLPVSESRHTSLASGLEAILGYNLAKVIHVVHTIPITSKSQQGPNNRVVHMFANLGICHVTFISNSTNAPLLPQPPHTQPLHQPTCLVLILHMTISSSPYPCAIPYSLAYAKAP